MLQWHTMYIQRPLLPGVRSDKTDQQSEHLRCDYAIAIGRICLIPQPPSARDIKKGSGVRGKRTIPQYYFSAWRVCE